MGWGLPALALNLDLGAFPGLRLENGREALTRKAFCIESGCGVRYSRVGPEESRDKRLKYEEQW